LTLNVKVGNPSKSWHQPISIHDRQMCEYVIHTFLLYNCSNVYVFSTQCA